MHFVTSAQVVQMPVTFQLANSTAIGLLVQQTYRITPRLLTRDGVVHELGKPHPLRIR